MYIFLQQYWWLVVSLLGAILVFLLFDRLAIKSWITGTIIAFNAKYLMDFLRVSGSNNIKFHLKSSLSPVMVSISDDTNYTYILTPIRTTN